jgi:hypothetical protein
MPVDQPAQPAQPAQAAQAADVARPRYSYAQKVLHAFVVNGRLVSIPARERKRQVVLRYLATTVFEDDREYPEREVDQRLALRHRDVAALRRYLVDSGYLERHSGIYRRRPMAGWPVQADDVSLAQPRDEASPDE